MALIKCPECKKKISDQCTLCPQCGYPIKAAAQSENLEIENIEAVEVVNSTKKPFYKKAWVWIVAGVVLLALVLGTVLLLTRNTKPKFDKEGNPVFVEMTNEVYTNAKEYRGYHVQIKGQVFQVIGDNGNTKGIQIWLDPETCEQNLMIYYSSDVEIKQDDYIVCTGYIDSLHKYSNSYGAKLYVPLVISADLQKATYIDVMAPTTATVTPENLKQEKHGYSISIDKVEFSERETRVYATATNNGSATLNIFNPIIVQNGKQYESKSNYEANYDEIPFELVTGVSSSGIIVFPALSTDDFELSIEVMSDAYEEDLRQFTFKITKDAIVVEEPKVDTPAPSQTSSTIQLNSSQKSKNQQAVEATEEIAKLYASVSPELVREILINDYGFTAAHATYGIKNANVDWGLFATTFLTDYIDRYSGNVTKIDAQNHLISLGFSNDAVDHALGNAQVNWAQNSPSQDTAPKTCTHYWKSATCLVLSTCSYCGETRGNYADHKYSKHTCTYCGKEEPWIPPSISCSDWVSLKELQDKAGYDIDAIGNITIRKLNDDRIKFVLTGMPSVMKNDTVYELDYNGSKVRFMMSSESNNINQKIKLQYADLVSIGVLS